MLECPATSREVVLKAIIGELVKCVPTNRLYGYAVTPLTENGGMNAEMDKFINTTYLYATVKADEVGQNVITTLPFVIPQLCQAKVVTMAMRQPEAAKHFSDEEIIWLDDKTKVAESIQSSVELWINKNPDRIKTPGSTATGERVFKRVIPRKVQPLFSAAKDNIVVNGAVPITNNATQSPQYDSNGVFISRPVGANPKFRKPTDPLAVMQETGFKTKVPVRRFGTLPQTQNVLVQPEPIEVNHVPGFEPPEPIRRGFSAIPPRIKKWEQDEVLPEITESIPTTQPQYKAEQEKQKETLVMEKSLHIVSNKTFQENPLKYDHHQLYKSFGIVPERTSAQTRADFMGALEHIKLTPLSEYQEISTETKPPVTFLWHDQINSAMCLEHSLVKTATGLIENDYIPGLDGHYAYNFDRYEAIKTFTDKSVLDLFMEEHLELSALFDNTWDRPNNKVSLGVIHKALTKLSASGLSSSIVELLNVRLTKAINYVLKYDLLSTYIIDDFIDDFEPLITVMVKALGNLGGDEVSAQMRGGEDEPTCPGNYLTINVANLVCNLNPDVVKQWNQVISTTKKDMASRSLFLVERHCVVHVSASFNSNIAVSAIPNKWSELRRNASPEIWALLEMLVEKQPRGGHLQVSKFHLVFNDGITIEAKPTALSLYADDDTTPRVYLARIMDPQDF